VDNGLLNDKRVRIFVMGDNKWRDEDDWPTKRAQMREFYLHSGGRANTLKGDGRLSTKVPTAEPPDEYTYNPENPVEVVTDWNLYGDREELLDKRFIERRDDVLVYTSEPLKEELEVCGRPFVALYASSDCPDTDWVAMLSDVYPDGRSINLGHGVLRARYRNSLEKAELMAPGKVYFTFELMSTCILFKPGHRLRLSITSSAFPMYDRNPNTGHPIGEDAELRIAHNTIYHDSERPSHILLPVVPLPQTSNISVNSDG
jgi:putative CocE/NonD family hydrolase